MKPLPALSKFLLKASNYIWYELPYRSKDRAIVIGGCGRSGTTLLRLMLNSHPQIYIGPETNIFSGVTERDPDSMHYLSTQLDLNMEQLLTWKSQADSHTRFVELVLRHQAKKHGKKYWGEKTPANVLRFGYILRHFPQAVCIHLIRDGRDTIASLKFHPKYQTVNGKIVKTGIQRPISKCTARWVRDVRAGLRFRSHPRYYELRYEDLITKPKASLKSLFNKLDLPWDSRVLTYHREADKTVDQTKFAPSHQAVKPISKKSVGRWQSDLTEKEKDYMFAQAGKLLMQLGYNHP